MPMKHFRRGSKLLVPLLALSAAVGLSTLPLRAQGRSGRVSGTVSDTQGHALLGATVTLMGPLLASPLAGKSTVERVITDAQGRFSVERLLPGWYSFQVTASTHLPAMRSGIHVEPGKTSQQNFVLGDILAPLRVQVPQGSVSSWGQDWKWILRTASASRPVLRFQQAQSPSRKKGEKRLSAGPSQRMIAMMPGSARGRALAGDPGLGSVMAYVRPLSDNSDLLLAGSMAANGTAASSLATALRRNLMKGDPQELTLVVHRLSFSEGVALATPQGHGAPRNGQALVLSYAHTRRLTGALSLTGGFEVDYLNAAQDAVSTRPRLGVEFQISPTTSLALRYGAMRPVDDGSLLDRIGTLQAFPRVTMKGFRPMLERLNHAEVSLSRHLGSNSRVELALYRDLFENAAIWGFASGEVLHLLAGSFLPNPAASGVTFNAGNYKSSGVRAAFTRALGSRVETAVIYAIGDALVFDPAFRAGQRPVGNLSETLRPQRTRTFGGKFTSRIPVTETEVTTSYQWIPGGRVTGVDPYGQSALQLQPFLGIQIRQPLPSVAFLPARIEALADFRNLLAQGYVPMSPGSEDALVLTPAYRSFRGGFSVQF